MEALLSKIKYNDQGLIPAVLQDIKSGKVLMMAYMNEESLKKTIKTGKATFWSRSRGELWLKGETSGNYQLVEEIRIDCDNDTLLLMVNPEGPACHTGKKSCFYRGINGKEVKENTRSRSYYIEKALFLNELYNVISDRKNNPVEGSYTNYLLEEGVDKICKKVGEEAAEVIIGAKNESRDEMIYEIGDLIYHLLVLMNLYEVSIPEVLEELEERHK